MYKRDTLHYKVREKTAHYEHLLSRNRVSITALTTIDAEIDQLQTALANKQADRDTMQADYGRLQDSILTERENLLAVLDSDIVALLHEDFGYTPPVQVAKKGKTK